jgi:hypothetical protein
MAGNERSAFFRIYAEPTAQRNYEPESVAVKPSNCKDRHPGHEARNLDGDLVPRR